MMHAFCVACLLNLNCVKLVWTVDPQSTRPSHLWNARPATHSIYMEFATSSCSLSRSRPTREGAKREGPSDNRAARCRNPDRPAVHEHGSLTRLVCTEWCNVESTFVVVSLKIQDSLRASAKNMPSEQAQWRRTSYDE